jgi:PAS domain S-box-containing protein
MAYDQTPALMWVSGLDKRCVWFNGPWLRFTGRSLDHELGHGWSEGIHPNDRMRVLDTYHAACDARQPLTIDFRLRRHDGEYRWVLSNAVPLLDDRKQLIGYVACCTDITERRRAEDDRTQSLEESEAANRLKDEFLATLSHELRTPLNTVLGWTHLLRERAQSDAEINNALDIIERSVRVQSKLVEDVLDVSRIVSGKLRLDLQTVDIANVIQAAVNGWQPTAEAKGVLLTLNVRNGHGFVAGDPARLHQVIWNVVSNGVKFTRRGGQVDIEARRHDGDVEIVVTDNGAGVRPDFLPYVFERFRQAESAYTREHGGLGLGLAIVRHLMEIHGGSVEIHSAGVDQGTTVRLRLPLLAVHPAEVAMNAAPHEQPTIAGVRVLVVDDDADARLLVREILEHGGASVTTAESAAEAWTILQYARFDVLISDLAMPIEDGCDLIRKVRALSAASGGDVPAAALTAYTRTEDRMRVVAAGFDRHLSKPIDPGELIAAVQALAAGRAPVE